MAEGEETNWFGARLRKAMDDAKLKPGDLARSAGVRAGTVSRWLGGEIRPREKNLRKLAEALDKPIHWFYEGEGAASTSPGATKTERQLMQWADLASKSISGREAYEQVMAGIEGLTEAQKERLNAGAADMLEMVHRLVGTGWKNLNEAAKLGALRQVLDQQQPPDGEE